VGCDTWEVYDLRRDPGEQTNLYAESSASGEQCVLVQQWKKWSEDNEALAEILARCERSETIELNEQQLQQLKALGYAQ
jgi:hypothetical protein